jgi:subfamily B ATP-binding cassette protein MsbA
MSLEQFIAIALALHLSYEPIKKLGEIHSLMKQGEAALDRLEEVLHTSDQVREAKNPKRPEVFRAEITLDQVRFAYGEEEILKGISTTIQPGECVAVIGPSGAGKSSLFKLIPRFYDVTSGSVKVSGIDVRDWSKKELRDHVAVVSQSPILFKGTIRENILLGRPDATEQEMIASAKRANAHDFILSQESGYDTNISEQGASLSGGQRQRIAIARAFLKDAPILLLDEATSALDNESEAKIQESLAELVKNRTTLMIAHRLTTTRIANRVLEVEQGEIVSERAQA